MKHEYDTRLLAAALRPGDDCWDRDAGLLRVVAKPNPIHTKIVSGYAHNLVQSMTYALALLEADRGPRAEVIIDRCLAEQDTDPDSRTYGLWGYFAEEPVAEMVPPDWNQADFHGRILALALLRYDLTPALTERMRTALGHAARSIIRRDVSMDYTNIAAKGTFVLIAAGKLLGDTELAEAGRERLHRFAANIDRTGSFPEYNSPTYWLIAAEAMTAIAEYAPEGVENLITAILRRQWTHLAAHWHPPTTQLTGPMSRAYAGSLVNAGALVAFLTKATGYAEPFASYELPEAGEVGLVFPAILEPRVPTELFDAFTQIPSATTHREIFQLHTPEGAAEQRGGPELPETVGTSHRDPVLTLGSVNQSDTWLQRLNLLGYWPQPSDGPWHRPARSVRLRLLRDGQDFSSGSFTSVQDNGSVLWSLALASPGGDRHIHLDMLDGPFEAKALTVRLELTGVDATRTTVNGTPAAAGTSFGVGDLIEVRDGDVVMSWHYTAGRFGKSVPKGRIDVADGLLVIDVDLVRDASPVTVEPSGDLYVAGALTISTGSPRTDAPTASRTGDVLSLEWTNLRLSSRATVGTRAEHASAYEAFVAGAPVAAPRLAGEERLLP